MVPRHSSHPRFFFFFPPSPPSFVQVTVATHTPLPHSLLKQPVEQLLLRAYLFPRWFLCFVFCFLFLRHCPVGGSRGIMLEPHFLLYIRSLGNMKGFGVSGSLPTGFSHPALRRRG